MPTNVIAKEDGTVSVEGMKLGYYDTRVAKTSKNKQKIFGTMVRWEETGSSKGKKIYMEQVMDEISSKLLFKVFEPDTYLARTAGVRGNGTVNKLMQEHVTEAVEFAVAGERYIDWLRTSA